MDKAFRELAQRNNITTQLYKQRIIELVRLKYSINDELSILRQRDTKPEEFDKYNAYVEECKQQAKKELEV